MDDTASLTALLEQDHEQALSALTDSPPRLSDAVAWLGAHLAAVEHVVYPAAGAAGTDDELLADARDATHQLLLLTRELELVCSGGAVPRGLSPSRLRDEMVEALVSHAADERTLVGDLLDRCDDAACTALARRYADAIRRGPTRPHPWGPHGGRLESLTFLFDRLRDRVLDLLDARPVPVPRRPRRPARAENAWSAYLLGAPLSSAPPRDTAEHR